MSDDHDQRFLTLATHTLANRATPSEKAEFEQLLSSSPANVERFENLKADLVVAKDILSLLAACEAKGPGLREPQVEHLHADVEKSLRSPLRRRRAVWIVLAGLFALIVLAAMCNSRRPLPPTVEIAWVDLGVGGTAVRAASAEQEAHELRQLKAAFPNAPVSTFREKSLFELWQARDPDPGVFRITCDHAGLGRTPELIVHGKTAAGAAVMRKFEATGSESFPTLVNNVAAFVASNIR